MQLFYEKYDIFFEIGDFVPLFINKNTSTESQQKAVIRKKEAPRKVPPYNRLLIIDNQSPITNHRYLIAI